MNFDPSADASHHNVHVLDNPQRPWVRIVIWIAAALSLGLFIALRLRTASVEVADKQRIDNGPIPHDQTSPTPNLTPRQVVWAQVESLRAALVDPAKTAICFEFASPENRTLTGPLDRFSSMVATEPFNKLANCQKYEISRTTFVDQNAAVSVLTIDSEGRELVFQFLLRRQTLPPFEECWMTEGVVPMLPH